MRIATAFLAAMLVAAVGGVPAAGYDQPGHVTCSYDETKLKKYQPETTVGHLDVAPTASYAAVYTSPERETAAYVYFLRYPHQRGLTAADSHVADREPVYVLVDEGTGRVERVVYSAYHYIKGAGTPSNMPMNGTHVRLHVVEPWHQYVPTGDPGTRVDLKDYCEAVDDWHANGWRASAEATKNPWTMRNRDGWWDENTLGHSLSERYWEARREVDDAVSNVTEGVPFERATVRRPGGRRNH